MNNASPESPAFLPSRRLTILVVDDEPAVLSLLRLTLEMQGHAVITAASGRVVLGLAQREQPDIILCDVHMPGMSGHQVLAALRDDYQTRHIPVIFLTGCAERQSIRLGMAGGAAEYLVKPFLPEELFDAIDACRRKVEWFDHAAARCA